MSAKSMIEAVLKAGLVSEEALEEMKRFSTVIPKDAITEDPKDLSETARIIATALESEGYVMVRETDLEVLQQYMETSRAGLLHVETEDGAYSEFGITFGRTRLGECIIAWRSESIEELLTNGLSYLEFEGVRTFFSDVRELFFGETKAFMVCRLSTKETAAPPTEPDPTEHAA